MNLEDLLTYLIEKGRYWVQEQRDHHRPSSRTLTDPEKAAFRPFFGEGILNISRVKQVPVIENPGFYAELGAMGIPPPLDFTTMEGITFIDTVLISDSERSQHEPLASLLFHELVHVVQYAWLGKDVFVERYVRGWAEGGQDYFSIPGNCNNSHTTKVLYSPAYSSLNTTICSAVPCPAGLFFPLVF